MSLSIRVTAVDRYLCNLRRTPWVTHYPKIHLKNQNSFTFGSSAIKLHNLDNICFLRVLMSNQVSWWNNYSAKLSQSQHSENVTKLKSWVIFYPRRTPWEFHHVKSYGWFSPTVCTVKVSPRKNHGWIFTHWVRGIDLPLLKAVWAFAHDVRKENFIATYGED